MNFKAPTGNFMTDFIEGNKKGIYMGLFVLAPALIFMYPILSIFQITGILGVIGKLFKPIMGIFGLPGETAITFATAFLNTGAGLATVAAYFDKGILNGYQVAIVVPMMWLISAQLTNTARVLNVIGTNKKYFLPIYLTGFVTAFIIGILGRVLVYLLW